MKACSLRGCDGEAAFEIYAGPDHFTTTVVGFACAFDRAEVMERLGRKYQSVVWHDIDEA